MRVVPITTGYRVTLNYQYANFICLEGATHRSVRYTITIGDAFAQAVSMMPLASPCKMHDHYMSQAGAVRH